MAKSRLQTTNIFHQAREKLLISVSILILLPFAMATLYSALLPIQNKFHLFEVPVPILIAAVALLSGVFWLAENLTLRGKLAKYYGLGITLAILTGIIIQLLIAHALLSSGYTWDSELLFEQAVRFAQTGRIDPSFAPYVSNSPNNIALLVGLGEYFRFVQRLGITNFLWAATLLNVVVLSLAQILTFLTVKLLYGRTVAAISLIFSFIFIGLTMYVHIPYTDTLTIIFPILILYLALRVAKTHQAWAKTTISAAIGAVGVLGYFVKPTVVIALIAIVIVAGLAAFNSKNSRRQSSPAWLTAVGCVMAFIWATILTVMLYSSAIDSTKILPFPIAKSQENSLPMAHFFAMGLKTTYHKNMIEYGGYDDQQATAISSIPDKDDRTRVAISLAKQRLSEYGPLGYVKFLAHKANAILSDGTFYAYGEGSNENVRFSHYSGPDRFIRSFMYADGRWYILFSNIIQVFWMAVLVLISAHLIILATDRTTWTDLRALLPRLMIGGILLFLLLFEARSRYIFLYVPVFIVAAMYTVSWFKRDAINSSTP